MPVKLIFRDLNLNPVSFRGRKQISSNMGLTPPDVTGRGRIEEFPFNNFLKY